MAHRNWCIYTTVEIAESTRLVQTCGLLTGTHAHVCISYVQCIMYYACMYYVICVYVHVIWCWVGRVQLHKLHPCLVLCRCLYVNKNGLWFKWNPGFFVLLLLLGMYMNNRLFCAQVTDVCNWLFFTAGICQGFIQCWVSLCCKQPCHTQPPLAQACIICSTRAHTNYFSPYFCFCLLLKLFDTHFISFHFPLRVNWYFKD